MRRTGVRESCLTLRIVSLSIETAKPLELPECCVALIEGFYVGATWRSSGSGTHFASI
jgi:hypothetical protein